MSNVLLVCGNVITHASISIGDKALFNLLLSRPWQWGNYISIDERFDNESLYF